MKQIPIMEEMQSYYEKDLRYEALKLEENESNKIVIEQGAFFEAFRKFEKITR